MLIVDDNATNRLILQEAVCDWQMLPTCEENGAAALETLRSAAEQGKPFVLVLLDAMMPRNGWIRDRSPLPGRSEISRHDNHDALVGR